VIAFGLVIQFQPGLTIVSSQRFDIMGVLALFLCINAFIGFLREKSVRQTFLSEYKLYDNGKTLIRQQEVSNNLLQAMLPMTIIKQVRTWVCARVCWCVRVDACVGMFGCVCVCVLFESSELARLRQRVGALRAGGKSGRGFVRVSAWRYPLPNLKGFACTHVPSWSCCVVLRCS
jgi:hypothetical protein